MSSSDEPCALTPEEKEAEAKFEQRFDHLMEEFFFSGDIRVLQEFIKRGGDIDQYDLRDIITDLMDATFEPNPGGAIDAINIGFYMAVEARMNSLRKKSDGKSRGANVLTLQEQLLSLKKVGKTAAIKEIAVEWSTKGRGVSYEGGRTRYKKGKELFKAKFGRVWN